VEIVRILSCFQEKMMVQEDSIELEKMMVEAEEANQVGTD